MAGENERIGRLREMFGHAEEINRTNLKEILSHNEKTFYGQKYGFTKIRNEDEFKRKVPLSDSKVYEAMGKWPTDFTAYPVECILTTSGTTGKQKEFCLTREALERYSSYICDMPYVLTDCGEGTHLHLSVFRPSKEGKTLLSAAYYSQLRETGLMDFGNFAGGETLLFSGKIGNVAYVKAWLALAVPELVSIQSIFLYDTLLFFTYLEHNWRRILDDMSRGNISAELTDEGKETLFNCRLTGEKLAARQALLEKGFDTPIAPRLWKNLKFISGIGGDMYKIQEQALKKYTGETPIYYFAYASSECMAGIALELDTPEYALLPGSAYYEFLSAEGLSRKPQDVYIGEEYEVAVTTFSGLYRYRTGDIVRIVSFVEETPVFKIIGRKKNVLNLAGEKLDEETVRTAVSLWAKEEKQRVKDFAVGIDARSVPGRYCLFAEVSEDLGKLENSESSEASEDSEAGESGDVSKNVEAEIGLKTEPPLKTELILKTEPESNAESEPEVELKSKTEWNPETKTSVIERNLVQKPTSAGSTTFDSILCDLSPDYQDIRSLSMLAPACVCLLPDGKLSELLSGGGEVHNKPHTLINPAQTEALSGWGTIYGK